jgi:sirohydrochlorin cobaltochelatase
MEKVKAKAMKDDQKAIVVVSFGTTFNEAREACIEGVENRIQEAFLGYDVYRAFTSRFVRKRLAERDHIYVDELETVLTMLQSKGYIEVVIQPTHLTPGEEYEKKVVPVVNQFKLEFQKIAIGRPLLFFDGTCSESDDFAIAIEALTLQIPSDKNKDCTIVFMGHGSPHQHNPAYEMMQQHFDRIGLNAVVGVVEKADYPNFSDVQQFLKERKSKKIILMPMLLVSGDHANNDMAGAGKESWKEQLLEQGYEVETYMHGLGENIAIQDIYVQHVRDAIKSLNI